MIEGIISSCFIIVRKVSIPTMLLSFLACSRRTSTAAAYCHRNTRCAYISSKSLRNNNLSVFGGKSSQNNHPTISSTGTVFAVSRNVGARNNKWTLAPGSSSSSSSLSLSSNNNNDQNRQNSPTPKTNEVTGPTSPSTWTYEPYDAKKAALAKKRQQQQQQSRRTFTTASSSNWIIPKSIEIPEDKVQLSFVRASGSGGQNVNKVSTKVELRVHVMTELTFIPHEVRKRLYEQEQNRINKDGYLTLSSQEYRTQVQNRKSVLSKLESMILQAYPRPKIRKQRTGISKASKERMKQDKKFRSSKKEGRKQVKDW